MHGFVAGLRRYAAAEMLLSACWYLCQRESWLLVRSHCRCADTTELPGHAKRSEDNKENKSWTSSNEQKSQGWTREKEIEGKKKLEHPDFHCGFFNIASVRVLSLVF